MCRAKFVEDDDFDAVWRTGNWRLLGRGGTDGRISIFHAIRFSKVETRRIDFVRTDATVMARMVVKKNRVRLVDNQYLELWT